MVPSESERQSSSPKPKVAQAESEAKSPQPLPEETKDTSEKTFDEDRKGRWSNTSYRNYR
jgi:hypothetical protein